MEIMKAHREFVMIIKITMKMVLIVNKKVIKSSIVIGDLNTSQAELTLSFLPA